MGGFSQKNSNPIFLPFFLLLLIFSYYNWSIDLKRLSEHSGIRPDTSSLVMIIIIITTMILASLTASKSIAS